MDEKKSKELWLMWFFWAREYIDWDEGVCRKYYAEKLKADFCKKYGLKLDTNCWFCEYVTNCEQCPLYDDRSCWAYGIVNGQTEYTTEEIAEAYKELVRQHALLILEESVRNWSELLDREDKKWYDKNYERLCETFDKEF